MQLDLGTLSGIIQAEKEIAHILTLVAYQNRETLKTRLDTLTEKEQGKLCIALNKLRDNMRVFRMTELTLTPKEE